MNHGSLFSGIGGFDLAAEWMGWNNLFNCEWEEFPRKVLKHHFPNAKQYGDIREFTATDYAGRIDILTGGFPCQPYSMAGKRKGKEDERHLWPEMLRIIRECSPRWVVGENVRGLVNWNGGLVFEEVCADLEACGYSVQPFILPACAVNAPHRRERVWFVAYANKYSNLRKPNENASANKKEGVQQRFEIQQPCKSNNIRFTSNANDFRLCSKIQNETEPRGDKQENGLFVRNDDTTPDSDDTRLQRGTQERDVTSIGKGSDQQPPRRVLPTWANFPTVAPICGGDDGLPQELDGISFPKWRSESIKAYGNAIVPQVALEIFKAIEAYEFGRIF